MATILVNLDIHHEVTSTRQFAGEISKQKLSENKLIANLIVTPDDAEGAAQWGMLNLQVAILNPRARIPEMTAEETRQWLVDLLKKTL